MSQFLTWADNKLQPCSEDDAFVVAIMERFPLEDQGMVLVYGALPSSATSYPVDKVFGPSSSQLPTPTDGQGFGLMFELKGTQARVQYGNGVHSLDTGDIRKFRVFATGLPYPHETPEDASSESLAGRTRPKSDLQRPSKLV